VDAARHRIGYHPLLRGLRVEQCAVNECARGPYVSGQPRRAHEASLTPCPKAVSLFARLRSLPLPHTGQVSRRRSRAIPPGTTAMPCTCPHREGSLSVLATSGHPVTGGGSSRWPPSSQIARRYPPEAAGALVAIPTCLARSLRASLGARHRRSVGGGPPESRANGGGDREYTGDDDGHDTHWGLEGPGPMRPRVTAQLPPCDRSDGSGYDR